MLTISTAPDYLLCLRCGFAGWLGLWREHCPECAAPLPDPRLSGMRPDDSGKGDNSLRSVPVAKLRRRRQIT